MEYSLRHGIIAPSKYETVVLILILMEYSLRLLDYFADDDVRVCLNPYSNGI